MGGGEYEDSYPLQGDQKMPDIESGVSAGFSDIGQFSYTVQEPALDELSSEEEAAQALAIKLGVEYLHDGPAAHTISRQSLELADGSGHPYKPGDFASVVTQNRGWREKPAVHIGCSCENALAVERMVSGLKLDRKQVFITAQSTLNLRQFQARSDFHVRNAESGLQSQTPQYSAATVITPRQSIAMLSLLVCVIVSGYFFIDETILAIHLVLTFLFLGVTLLRAAVIMPSVAHMEALKRLEVDAPATDAPTDLPFYTVVVALYKEAGQIADLGEALGKIDWPANKIQFLLVCEEDDQATILACQQLEIDSRFRTLVCPPSTPKTKPKALNFALPLATGEYLVLYDAEDRPHPQQLREAHQKFTRRPDLACLQAPLRIHNMGQSWLSTMFAIEYRTLFRGILPALEHWRSPMPLGGTSNHFRLSVLREAGAWDSHNVTEDADLGIRLARMGFQCGTLNLPTHEEAPPIYSVWLKQRTRWVKGWMQTMLVHMRHPRILARQLGPRRTFLFHLVLTSMVLSFIIYPFFLISFSITTIQLVTQTYLTQFTYLLLGIDVFNLVGGYSTYMMLAWYGADQKELRPYRWWILTFPIYWMLISYAGWRACMHLLTKPFEWEKTEHGLAPRFGIIKNANK